MKARILGSGTETLVLGHGYGGNQSHWDKLIPNLTPHYNVVVFDWAFADTATGGEFDRVKYSTFEGFVDDLIALMDELDIKDSIFMGHSMSGMIGCIASVKRPDLFERLILLAASPRYINIDDYEGGFDKSGIDVQNLISCIESDFHGWATGFAPIAVAGDPISIPKFETTLKSMSSDAALVVAKAIFYSDYRDILEQVTTPTTIIQSARDPVVPCSVAYYMKLKIKGKSTVEIIDTDGHLPHLTAHDQLLHVLRGVLGFN
jgi:pimeloyl-ACP methyl ester carboxylesterase